MVSKPSLFHHHLLKKTLATIKTLAATKKTNSSHQLSSSFLLLIFLFFSFRSNVILNLDLKKITVHMNSTAAELFIVNNTGGTVNPKIKVSFVSFKFQILVVIKCHLIYCLFPSTSIAVESSDDIVCYFHCCY